MVLTTLECYKSLFDNVKRHERIFRESEGDMKIANAKSLLKVLDSYCFYVPESTRQEVDLDVKGLKGECNEYVATHPYSEVF